MSLYPAPNRQLVPPDPPPPNAIQTQVESVRSPVATRSRSARSQAQARIKEARQNVLPRIHTSVANKEALLQYYRANADLFMEHEMTTEQLQLTYQLLQLYCVDRSLKNADLYEKLPLTQQYNLVSFIGGNWWRLSRSPTKRTVAWRKQTITYSSSGRTLVEDKASKTYLKREQVDVVGVWCRTHPGGRISKSPFFGIKRSINFDLGGSPLASPVTLDDAEAIRLQVATAPFSTSSLAPQTAATTCSGGDAGDMAKTAASIAADTSCTPTDTPTPTLGAPPSESQTPVRGEEPPMETQAQTPVAPQEQQERPPHPQETPPSQHQAEPPNGFELISTSTSCRGRKGSAELPCSIFRRPEGLVPRILYGARGRRFVETLVSKAERLGNDLLLTWLNIPGLFQSAPCERTEDAEETDEKIRRLSVRKFQFGNVGQSFKVLQREPRPKVKPTAQEIQTLFPEPVSPEPVIRPKRDTAIQVSLEELLNTVAKLPRDRAGGESQLSYDHIKYAISKDETAGKMLQSSVNFLLNNPESANQQLYTATAYFLQKENGGFRPIVLQETLTKIAHRCLNRRLLAMLRGRIPERQFCINCANGTTMAALEIQRELKEAKAKYITAVDFSNAFNSLSRHTLINNMTRLNIGGSYVSYVATYLERFRVRYGGLTIENKRGVPQGCPLSMTLFAIGTSHLIRILEKKGVRVYAYADDMAIVADSREQMEAAMQLLETKARECGLTINREKTKGYTTQVEDEDGYSSLHKNVWTYLGIPISLDPHLVEDEFSKAVDKVAEKAEKAWRAPLLQQAYFINRLCIGPMLSHIARGTNLRGNTDTFLNTQQRKIDKHMPPVIAKIPRAWRLQPVAAGGLGLSDVCLTQKAAREALLIEAGEKTPDGLVGARAQTEKEDGEGKWQARLTKVLHALIVEEQQTKMSIGKQRRDPEPEVSTPHDSLWLSCPPTSPAHVLSDTAFSIAIQLRYGMDELASLGRNCPFCEVPLTLKHSLVCPKANKGTFIARHNTVTRIIGTSLAARGTIAEYERKLPTHSDDKPHIPDITYLKDSTQHHIDVAICQRYGKHRDMRQTTIVSKTYKYRKTWGKMFKNVHFVIYDNSARPAQGVPEYLRDLGVGAATMRTIQTTILRANETCFRRVLGRANEEINRMYVARAKALLIPQNLIKDTVGI